MSRGFGFSQVDAPAVFLTRIGSKYVKFLSSPVECNTGKEKISFSIVWVIHFPQGVLFQPILARAVQLSAALLISAVHDLADKHSL
jgi:hypothetical protein